MIIIIEEEWFLEKNFFFYIVSVLRIGTWSYYCLEMIIISYVKPHNCCNKKMDSSIKRPGRCWYAVKPTKQPTNKKKIA